MPKSTLEHPRHVFSTTLPAFSTAFPMQPSAHPRPLNDVDGNEDKNGMIIVQNDQIFITPPLPGGRAALISAVHPVVLKINQMKVTDPTEVTSADYLSWEFSEKPLYQITISEDKLRAYFTLYRVEKYAWKLVNCPASADVSVRAEPNYDLLLSKLTVEQILSGFPKSSFMPNLNIPALYAELNNPTYLPICIAVGKAPVPGTNGRLESLLQLNMADEFSTLKAPSTMDYLDYPGIASVRAGEVLARKLPPQEGLPGFDVYGGIVPAPQPEDISLLPSAGTTLLPSGEIIALREGRPRITGCGRQVMRIDFPAAHMMPGGMETADGTFIAAGDVIAPEGVGGHNRIEALGNVYICGDVLGVVIAATGSIVIRGKISDCQLYSGYCGAKQQRLYRLPSHLMKEITGLRTAARLLEENLLSRQQTVRYGLVIMLLLESKYSHLPDLISGLQELLADKGPAYPMITEELKHMLEVFLHPGQFTDFITDDVVGTLLKLLEELSTRILNMQEENARMDIAQAENCLLHSGGDLYIHKEGVKNSTLRACGNVQFLMEHSACSGSIVEAGGSITAQRVGAEAVRQSALTAASQISVCQISGTCVSIGGYTAEITGAISEDTLFTAQNLRMRNQK
jgi:hypothetical protein